MDYLKYDVGFTREKLDAKFEHMHKESGERKENKIKYLEFLTFEKNEMIVFEHDCQYLDDTGHGMNTEWILVTNYGKLGVCWTHYASAYFAYKEYKFWIPPAYIDILRVLKLESYAEITISNVLNELKKQSSLLDKRLRMLEERERKLKEKEKFLNISEKNIFNFENNICLKPIPESDKPDLDDLM